MDHTAGRTRRKILKTAAGLAGAGALAGCTQPGTTGGSSGESGESYTTSIEPMGEVEFDSVPETWVANNGSWADMGVALGLEPPKGVWMASRYHTRYYDEIPDVSVDKSEIKSLYQDGVGKEQFYALDADVHVIDPNFLMNRFKGWEQGDVDDIREKVAPFFGNSIFSRGYDWHQNYRYYTLYEAFEKLSQVFQRTDRYEAMVDVHESFQENLAPVVPSRSERPAAAVVWAGGDAPEEFLPYVQSDGTSFKHLNDLEVKDALATSGVKDFHSNRGAIDYETLLEIDPEVLLVRGQEAKTGEEFRNTVVSAMKNNEAGSDLTAVKNGDVYRAGPLYQGPITNLVVTERTAQALYDHDGDLFDRQRVADIVNGEF